MNLNCYCPSWYQGFINNGDQNRSWQTYIIVTNDTNQDPVEVWVYWLYQIDDTIRNQISAPLSLNRGQSTTFLFPPGAINKELLATKKIRRLRRLGRKDL
jgi:hypothetical protein